MNNNFQPIVPQNRIEILDLLRGFALIGIIFDNIMYFSGYKFMPYNELQLFSTFALDEKLYQLLNIVIKGKFYRIFALLFGVGFYLQLYKNINNSKFIKIYRRRLSVLLIIGSIHSLIWSGDILLMYSLTGFVFVAFHKMESKNIFRFAIFFMLFFIMSDLMSFIFYHGTTNSFDSIVVSSAHVNFPDMKSFEVMNVFRNGNVGEIFLLNIHNLVWKWLSKIPAGSVTNTIGIFLLGFYLASKNFFTVHLKSKKLLLISFLIGYICTFYAKWLGGSATQFPPDLVNTFLYKTSLYIGQLSLSFFYMSLLATITALTSRWNFMNYLKPVGRMALSNYLFQTIMLIIIFYNFGFNLIGKLGLIYIAGIAVLILTLQIVISNIWLKYYKFGPFEWVWRCLTYRKRISIKKIII